MFTMETMNPTHFQLDIQIMHYDDILQYCTESYMNLYVIVLEAPDWRFIVLLVTCYQVITAGKRSSLTLVGKDCTNEFC